MIYLRQFPVFLMMVFFGVNLVSASDVNQDGLSDLTGLEKNSKYSNIISEASDISIGLIKSGSYTSAADRLIKSGFTRITQIDVNAGIDTLSKYNVIYLPVNWASEGAGHAETIQKFRADYIQYVNNGGGLLIEQPNPNPDTITVTIVPKPVFIEYSYTLEDFPPVITDSSHYLTQGLTAEELPFPADQIDTLDAMYHVLTRGKLTGSPGLFVAEHGKGKILFEMAHHSTGATHPLSDSTFVRMFSWVAGDASGGINALDSSDPVTPDKYYLAQNYPNPFNPSTTISFALPRTEHVVIKIFGLTGTEIMTLADRPFNAGQHKVEFSASDLASGIYFYHISAGSYTQTRRMVYLK